MPRTPKGKTDSKPAKPAKAAPRDEPAAKPALTVVETSAPEALSLIHI